MIRSYSDLAKIDTFKGRFEYLQLNGKVGYGTFDWSRYLNQKFYSSNQWRNFRNEVIVRDSGHDLGMLDDIYDIHGPIYIHHINPITKEDILCGTNLFDMDNVICVSFKTHQAIHYGCYSQLFNDCIERSKGDTTLW